MSTKSINPHFIKQHYKKIPVISKDRIFLSGVELNAIAYVVRDKVDNRPLLGQSSRMENGLKLSPSDCLGFPRCVAT